jgi:hypothetical protein
MAQAAETRAASLVPFCAMSASASITACMAVESEF